MVERTTEFSPDASRMYTVDLAHSGSYPFSVYGDGTFYPPTMDGVLLGGVFPDLIVHCSFYLTINSPISEIFPWWDLYIEERISGVWQVVHTEHSAQFGVQAPPFYSNEWTHLRLLDTYGDSETRFTLPTSGTHTYRIRMGVYSQTSAEYFDVISPHVFVVNCVPRDSLYDVILTGIDFIQNVEYGDEVTQIATLFNNYPGRVYYTFRAWEIGGTFEYIEGKDPIEYPGEYRILGAHDPVTISFPYVCSSPNVSQLCVSIGMIRPV